MGDKNLTEAKMIEALTELDSMLDRPILLIIGGGGAMILAHQFPLATSDIDAFPKGIELSELDVLVKKVAQKLSLPHDWLNPYFSTFGHVLPSDYDQRLIRVYKGKWIEAKALSKEDLLIMKCFAARQKDVSHVRALVKNHADTKFVERHIQHLIEKNIPGAQRALEFLHDTEDWMGNHE